MNIEELTIQEKIGQMFMIGLEENFSDKTIEMIKKYKIGGIILYKKNYSSYEQMLKIVNTIKDSNVINKVPMFISIDQEGGRVNRMPADIKNIKSAKAIADTKDIKLVKESGRILGEMLNSTGINMNYAPVLDIKRFEENHPIGNRCYGEKKEDVIKYGIEVMKEIQKQKVISVIKHFPGHGTTKKDSHFRIPKISANIKEVEKEDIIPFKEAISQDADAIMIGHLVIKDIDKKYPASISKKVIQKYLKDFKGLIITDDLKMFAIRLHYNLKRAVVKAIEAGNDIVMVGVSYDEIKQILKYVCKQVEKGKLNVDRINQSVEKIIRMKEKYEISNKNAKGFDIKEINARIENINISTEKIIM